MGADLYPYGFLDTPVLFPAVAQYFCKASNGTVCSISVDAVCGTSHLDDEDAVTNLTAHFPAGTSVKDLNHYAQFIQTGLMRRYDYGRLGNLEHYFHFEPPTYNLKEIKVNTALFMGSHDALADPDDMKQLLAELNGTSSVVFQKEYTNYSHVTWLVGKSWEWFGDLSKLLKQYNPHLDVEVVV